MVMENRCSYYFRGERAARTSPLLRIVSGQYGQTRTWSTPVGVKTRVYAADTNVPQFCHSGIGEWSQGTPITFWATRWIIPLPVQTGAGLHKRGRSYGEWDSSENHGARV